MAFAETCSILRELSQCIGQPVAFAFEIPEPVAAGCEGRNSAQQILSLLGGFLLGPCPEGVGFLIRLVGLRDSLPDRVELCLQCSSPQAGVRNPVIQ